MAKKPGGGEYGYDPERAAVRNLFDALERRAEQRPVRSTQQLGKVLDLPKVTTATERRLLKTHAAILDGPAREIAYQHTALAQCSLPYRPTDLRVWERRQGQVFLRVDAGPARHPDTGEWVDLPLPHGEKARLVLIHLNCEARRTKSPVIDVKDSMTAFVRSLGLATHGRNITTIKDQLARLAAATIRLGVGTVTIKTDVIDAFDLWWPENAKQRVLWPSTVQLSPRYFESLMEHAVPLDKRAVAALAHSALELDIYAWLAQRLHRIDPSKPQPVTWSALKAQFGPDYDRLRKFREKFKEALRAVLTVYPGARIEEADEGLLLWRSKPPIAKRMVAVSRLEPPTIDGTVVKAPGSGDKPAD